MKQVVFPKFCILSAELSINDSKINAANTGLLHKELIELGLSFQAVVGRYNGSNEVSFLVITDNAKDREEVERLTLKYNQECYLFCDSDQTAKLVYEDGQEEFIGSLVELSEREAIALDSYTKIDCGYTCKARYFTFRKVN